MRYALLALLLSGCGTPMLAGAPLCHDVTLDSMHFGDKRYVKECTILEASSEQFRHMNPQTYRAP